MNTEAKNDCFTFCASTVLLSVLVIVPTLAIIPMPIILGEISSSLERIADEMSDQSEQKDSDLTSKKRSGFPGRRTSGGTR